jgi:hypothetical protein
LTTGRRAASHTGHPSDGNPAHTGRRFPHACVTRKRQILNHALKRSVISHLRSLSKSPQRVLSLFRHPTFRYAA